MARCHSRRCTVDRPRLSALRTWGTPVLVHNAKGSKLDVRAREAHWLGLDVDAKGPSRLLDELQERHRRA